MKTIKLIRLVTGIVTCGGHIFVSPDISSNVDARFKGGLRIYT